jgi:hypothetical protein
MNDSTPSYEQVREIMYDILFVLHQHGIKIVSVGGIMRLLGVAGDVASAHDDEYLQVTTSEIEMADDHEVAPPGTTLH